MYYLFIVHILFVALIGTAFRRGTIKQLKFTFAPNALQRDRKLRHFNLQKFLNRSISNPIYYRHRNMSLHKFDLTYQNLGLIGGQRITVFTDDIVASEIDNSVDEVSGHAQTAQIGLNRVRELRQRSSLQSDLSGGFGT